MDCANGWPVLELRSNWLHKWVIPNTDRTIILRNGSAGFLLIHFALWFHDRIEPIDVGTFDDWGYNKRQISGSKVWSNHAGGTAIDINATKHPQHISADRTFNATQRVMIRQRLRKYFGCVSWGGDWHPEFVDPMHFEITGTLSHCENVSRKLLTTKRGERILKANPGQRTVILS